MARPAEMIRTTSSFSTMIVTTMGASRLSAQCCAGGDRRHQPVAATR
jgi:hypothetical protein